MSISPSLLPKRRFDISEVVLTALAHFANFVLYLASEVPSAIASGVLRATAYLFPTVLVLAVLFPQAQLFSTPLSRLTATDLLPNFDVTTVYAPISRFTDHGHLIFAWPPAAYFAAIYTILALTLTLRSLKRIPTLTPRERKTTSSE